jgi:hypothetical protein
MNQRECPVELEHAARREAETSEVVAQHAGQTGQVTAMALVTRDGRHREITPERLQRLG